jgi:hypothetical protein
MRLDIHQENYISVRYIEGVTEEFKMYLKIVLLERKALLLKNRWPVFESVTAISEGGVPNARMTSARRQKSTDSAEYELDRRRGISKRSGNGAHTEPRC